MPDVQMEWVWENSNGRKTKIEGNDVKDHGDEIANALQTSQSRVDDLLTTALFTPPICCWSMQVAYSTNYRYREVEYEDGQSLSAKVDSVSD